jgi:plastocyanin
VIWFRAILIVVIVGVAVAALVQTVARPALQPEPPAPTTVTVTVTAPAEPATRVPLPTLAPQAITSSISRSTPAPPPLATPLAQPSVEVIDYGYSPQLLSVAPGASVTWANDGNDGHDVTGSGPGGDWRSGPLAPSERYTRQFDLAGTYNYVCTLHPEMWGRVIVQS